MIGPTANFKLRMFSPVNFILSLDFDEDKYIEVAGALFALFVNTLPKQTIYLVRKEDLENWSRYQLIAV